MRYLSVSSILKVKTTFSLFFDFLWLETLCTLCCGERLMFVHSWVSTNWVMMEQGTNYSAAYTALWSAPLLRLSVYLNMFGNFPQQDEDRCACTRFCLYLSSVPLAVIQKCPSEISDHSNVTQSEWLRKLYGKTITINCNIWIKDLMQSCWGLKQLLHHYGLFSVREAWVTWCYILLAVGWATRWKYWEVRRWTLKVHSSSLKGLMSGWAGLN